MNPDKVLANSGSCIHLDFQQIQQISLAPGEKQQNAFIPYSFQEAPDFFKTEFSMGMIVGLSQWDLSGEFISFLKASIFPFQPTHHLDHFLGNHLCHKIPTNHHQMLSMELKHIPLENGSNYFEVHLACTGGVVSKPGLVVSLKLKPYPAEAAAGFSWSSSSCL